jgi:aryl-alcohol dehydrogenase-like predicted oxidoreductase
MPISGAQRRIREAVMGGVKESFGRTEMMLKDYITLGRSGLRVSPLCLGTMTFGTEWGWGAAEDTARAIFNRYLEVGGSFIDTADGYTNGKSEEMVGKFVREGGLRDRVVIATKFTFNAQPGNPNAGGNGRKNVYRALEGSLRRIQTDYVDLYWLHAWDTVTPVEEVISTMDDLVRAGKIRHYGFSDTPAWYAARAHTIAEKAGRERPIALQLEYSMVERNIEREHIPAAQELGMAVCPWSPLAGGFLTGKYKREGNTGRGEGRIELARSLDHPVFRKMADWTYTERNWRILDALLDVAKQINKSPAQVALNWVATQPGVTSTIIGATKLRQLEDNLAALEFTIPAELRNRLSEVSAIQPVHPYVMFGQPFQGMISGGVAVYGWNPAHATGAPAAVATAKASAAE